MKCKKCSYPDEDNSLRVIVKDGVTHQFTINDKGNLEHYDSDGHGQEIYLECPLCGQCYEFDIDDENWFLELEQIYQLNSVNFKRGSSHKTNLNELMIKEI